MPPSSGTVVSAPSGTRTHTSVLAERQASREAGGDPGRTEATTPLVPLAGNQSGREGETEQATSRSLLMLCLGAVARLHGCGESRDHETPRVPPSHPAIHRRNKIGGLARAA